MLTGLCSCLVLLIFLLLFFSLLVEEVGSQFGYGRMHGEAASPGPESPALPCHGWDLLPAAPPWTPRPLQ